MTSTAIMAAAVIAARTVDRDLRASVPNDVVNCIYGFSAGAAALALTPIPGLDVALVTADVWTMYVRINKQLGISFSDNLMKSIGSAIMGNLTANAGQLLVGGALKLIPGLGTAIGGGIMAATVFGTTLAAGLVYLKAITKFFSNGGGNGDLKSCVYDVLRDNKDEISKIQKDGKSEYKK